MNKILANEDFYNKTITYLEEGYHSFHFDDSLRSIYLKRLLTKYIRTVKSIAILDLEGYQKEGIILIRSLDEMIIDIAYLELNKDDYYVKYDLYAEAYLYEIIKSQCDYDKEDINNFVGVEKLKIKHEEYIKQYKKMNDRWSGLNYRDEAIAVDKNTRNPIMSFEKLYMKLYKANLLYSHNSAIVLNSDYKDLDINAKIDYINFDNINYVVLLTGLLSYVLPDIYSKDITFAKEFDVFLAGLKLIDCINN